MNEEVIAVFQSATTNVFATMLDQQIAVGTAQTTGQMLARHEISGIIGLSGGISGDVIVSLNERVAIRAAGQLLGTEPAEPDSDVIDTVGELTNMIAGSAKGMLESYNMSLALPTVILGSGHQIAFKSGVNPISIPFESDWGTFAVEIGLKIDTPLAAH